MNNNKYRNIFPLLEEEEERRDDKDFSELICQRLQWLMQASKATQEEFTLQLRKKEPAKSAHPTWAAVLATQQHYARWLEMEKKICARKLSAPTSKPLARLMTLSCVKRTNGFIGSSLITQRCNPVPLTYQQQWQLADSHPSSSLVVQPQRERRVWSKTFSEPILFFPANKAVPLGTFHHLFFFGISKS